MIDIILHFSGTKKAFKTGVENLNEQEKYNVTYREIPEMPKCYGLLADKTTAKKIATIIRKNTKVSLIAAWNNKGKKFTLDNEDDNFTIEKYRRRLRKKRILDANGDLIDEREHTTAEAKQFKINKIYGWDDKEII